MFLCKFAESLMPDFKFKITICLNACPALVSRAGIYSERELFLVLRLTLGHEVVNQESDTGKEEHQPDHRLVGNGVGE